MVLLGFRTYRRLDNIKAILILEAATLKSEELLPNYSRRFLGLLVSPPAGTLGGLFFSGDLSLDNQLFRLF